MQILLVEDSPGDANVTTEAFGRARRPHVVSVVTDGEAAMAHLRRQTPYEDAPRPDLMLVDLNLPLKSGIEVVTGSWPIPPSRPSRSWSSRPRSRSPTSSVTTVCMPTATWPSPSTSTTSWRRCARSRVIG